MIWLLNDDVAVLIRQSETLIDTLLYTIKIVLRKYKVSVTFVFFSVCFLLFCAYGLDLDDKRPSAIPLEKKTEL